MKEQEKCSQCEKNNAEDIQYCPYDDELNPDLGTFCNCCESCRNECLFSI